MRILIFHGYLLHGTGSNVYNAKLAAALVRLGHEVHLLCQDRRPFEIEGVDAAGAWDGDGLEVAERRSPPRLTVYRPDIGGLLPVYVADRYEGIEARPFEQLSDREVEDYVQRNVAAAREVVERVRPEVALANHLVMGPAIVARALAGTGIPYAVKVHGSALEYTVKPHPRFLGHAREGLREARAVLVGSRHTAESLWAAVDEPGLVERTRLGPPGVDVEEFAAREPEEAVRRLRALADGLAARGEQHGRVRSGDGEASAFARDERAAAAALAALRPGAERLVAFVGKLIVSKGIDLLLAAWPLVLDRHPDARLVVVGFGSFEPGCRRLIDALAAGDEAQIRAVAYEGRALEGGPRRPLAHLLAFLDDLDDGARRRYLAAAGQFAERVVFTGRLEHGEVAELLPACEALVMPSTFPESYGMVAAEAAACGAFPVSAAHSGMAEVSAALAERLPARARPWLSFAVGPGAVPDIAACLSGWLEAPPDLRAQVREALAAVARARFSWEGVAEGVIAAAQGRLAELPVPPPG